MLIWLPTASFLALCRQKMAISFFLVLLFLACGCQQQLPQHPNDVALAYLRERSAGFPGTMFVASNPGAVAAWAPSEYQFPDPCTKIILDREMLFMANTVGDNADQSDFVFRYQEQELWKGLQSTVFSAEGMVVTENSFGSTLWPPTPRVLWYQVRFTAVGGPDGGDVVTQWLLMRPTAEGWKIFQRPETIEARGAPVAEWSRVREK